MSRRTIAALRAFRVLRRVFGAIPPRSQTQPRSRAAPSTPEKAASSWLFEEELDEDSGVVADQASGSRWTAVGSLRQVALLQVPRLGHGFLQWQLASVPHAAANASSPTWVRAVSTRRRYTPTYSTSTGRGVIVDSRRTAAAASSRTVRVGCPSPIAMPANASRLLMRKGNSRAAHERLVLPHFLYQAACESRGSAGQSRGGAEDRQRQVARGPVGPFRIVVSAPCGYLHPNTL